MTQTESSSLRRRHTADRRLHDDSVSVMDLQALSVRFKKLERAQYDLERKVQYVNPDAVDYLTSRVSRIEEVLSYLHPVLWRNSRDGVLRDGSGLRDRDDDCDTTVGSIRAAGSLSNRSRGEALSMRASGTGYADQTATEDHYLSLQISPLQPTKGKRGVDEAGPSSSSMPGKPNRDRDETLSRSSSIEDLLPSSWLPADGNDGKGHSRQPPEPAHAHPSASSGVSFVDPLPLLSSFALELLQVQEDSSRQRIELDSLNSRMDQYLGVMAQGSEQGPSPSIVSLPPREPQPHTPSWEGAEPSMEVALRLERVEGSVDAMRSNLEDLRRLLQADSNSTQLLVECRQQLSTTTETFSLKVQEVESAASLSVSRVQQLESRHGQMVQHLQALADRQSDWEKTQSQTIRSELTIAFKEELDRTLSIETDKWKGEVHEAVSRFGKEWKSIVDATAHQLEELRIECNSTVADLAAEIDQQKTTAQQFDKILNALQTEVTKLKPLSQSRSKSPMDSKPAAASGPGRVEWHYSTTVPELEALLSEIHTQGKSEPLNATSQERQSLVDDLMTTVAAVCHLNGPFRASELWDALMNLVPDNVFASSPIRKSLDSLESLSSEQRQQDEKERRLVAELVLEFLASVSPFKALSCFSPTAIKLYQFLQSLAPTAVFHVLTGTLREGLQLGLEPSPSPTSDGLQAEEYRSMSLGSEPRPSIAETVFTPKVFLRTTDRNLFSPPSPRRDETPKAGLTTGLNLKSHGPSAQSKANTPNPTTTPIPSSTASTASIGGSDQERENFIVGSREIKEAAPPQRKPTSSTSAAPDQGRKQGLEPKRTTGGSAVRQNQVKTTQVAAPPRKASPAARARSPSKLQVPDAASIGSLAVPSDRAPSRSGGDQPRRSASASAEALTWIHPMPINDTTHRWLDQNQHRFVSWGMTPPGKAKKGAGIGSEGWEGPAAGPPVQGYLPESLRNTKK